MNTELQAMIDAGRKLIAEQATAEQRKTAHAVAEAERLKGIHLAKLPKWMREYVTVTHWDHSVRIYLDLPGCAQIYADSVSWSDGFVQLGVANPLAVLLDDEGEDWYVTEATHSCHELETAVALAADYGEAYWRMHAEADRRNAAGLRPEPEPTGEPVTPEPENETAAQRWIDTILLDGKHDGRALDGKSLAQDVRDLDAAKARLKKLLGIEGKITGDALYNLAADEIERLRQQLAHLDMLAAVMSDASFEEVQP